MKRISKLLGLLALGISTYGYAGTMGNAAPERVWVNTLSLGPVWPTDVHNQTFYLAPDIEKSYQANKHNNAFFYGEYFLGIQKAWANPFKYQIGLALAATSDAKLQGVIWDDADPRFDNYSYKYKVLHGHLAVKGKLLADVRTWLTPWVSGSVGVGVNRAHSFQNTPLIFEAVRTSDFGSHTKAAVTWSLGAGIQKSLSQNWQIGIGYEFSDLGKTQLRRALGQTLNTGLQNNHFYTNGVLVNLTYLA